MQIARFRDEIRRVRSALAGHVGVVPTMGALHDGHLALIRSARRECDAVVATLFVNPTQFHVPADLAAYPRDEARDFELFERAGVDVVFAPPSSEIYPEGFSSRVSVGELGAVLEGTSRPNHFDGVATVVAKLFQLTRPTAAYFGQKDWQQTRVIRRLVIDLDFDLNIRVVATVRESDGLALSSRNRQLSTSARVAATCLIRGLRAVRSAWDAGERGVTALEDVLSAPAHAEPLAALDYARVVNAESLRRVDPASAPVAFLIAADFGGVRLIDNDVIGPELIAG